MRLATGLLLLAALTLGACRNGGAVVDTGNNPGGDKAPAGRIALLEHEYVNHAWGYQHRGIVVTGDGAIFSYEWARDDAPSIESDRPSKSGADLLEKYAHGRKELGTVGADTLALVRSLLNAAERGELTEKESRGADMGQSTRLAYRYASDNQMYTQIFLRSDGDFEWRNTAPEAARLAEIIDAIAERYR